MEFDRMISAEKIIQIYRETLENKNNEPKTAMFDNARLEEIAGRIEAEWGLVTNKVNALLNVATPASKA